MFKEQKGVTLIALVITIIVLLILAGVSIAFLTGDNGLISKAKSSKVTTIEATVDEEVRLAIAATKLDIEQKAAKNNQYTALNDFATATTGLKAVLEKDLTTAKGYTVSALGTPATGKATFTITYKGTDYQNANNNANAQIVYTVELTQFSISIQVKADGTENIAYTRGQ